MIKFKKTVTGVLVGGMLLSSLTAFAADGDITINMDAPNSTQKYTAWRILDLTTSLKPTADAGGVHKDAGGKALTDATGTCDGTNHTELCYNYAYTFNTKFHNIIKTVAEADKDTDDKSKADADKDGTITDDELMEYIQDLGTDTAAIRVFANGVYKAITDGHVAADLAETVSPVVATQQGYYLIAETTNDADPDSTSLVMLDTAGRNEITVKTKEGVPTLDKSVVKEDGTEVDAVDTELNEWVQYKLTGTIPPIVDSYPTYKYVFHDTLSNGLTFNNTDKATDAEHGYVVAIDGTEIPATDGGVTNWTLTPSVEHGVDPDKITHTFDVEFENIKAVLTKYNITLRTAKPAEGENPEVKEVPVTFSYWAQVDADAVPGNPGNPNDAYIEFTNDPYNTNETSTTPEDEVKVFTFQLNINKTDGTAPLAGANFTLYKETTKDGNTGWGDGEQIGDFVSETDLGHPYRQITPTAGQTAFVFDQIKAGKYKLVESTVPDGYNKMHDKIFTIEYVVNQTEADQSISGFVVKDESGNVISRAFDDTADAAKPWVIDTRAQVAGADQPHDGTAITDIVNTTGGELPTTGAREQAMLLYVGLGAVALSLCVAVFASRKLKDDKKEN